MMKYTVLLIMTLLTLACSTETSMIKEARKLDTIEGYENYLSTCEGGKHSKEAKQQIEDIKFSRLRDSSFSSFIDILKTGNATNSAAIRITPANNVLMGTPVNVELRNLHPNKTHTLHAYRRRWNGLFYSFATFRADGSGRVFPDKDKPLDGTYSGVDPLGIFWSMTKPSRKGLELPFRIKELGWNTIYFNLETDGEIISRNELILNTAVGGVVKKRIHNDRFSADLFYPENKSNLPVMIFIGGGSKGELGYRNQCARIIASHGYAMLSLSYTNVDGLPKHLQKVPLEYFFDVMDWAKQESIVDGEKIILVGGSRAGELVLLLASMDPDVKGVIAVAPSSIIWQALPHNPFSMFFPKAAWTYKGKALPYVKHKNRFSTTWKFISGARQIEIMKSHEGIIDDEKKIEPAIIKVENINGPILFIAGKDDRMWPTYQMCQMMEHRLNRLNFKHPVQGLYYDNAGHQVTLPDLPPTIEYKYEQVVYGGTDSGNAAAQIDSWNKMLEFLETYFPINAN